MHYIHCVLYAIFHIVHLRHEGFRSVAATTYTVEIKNLLNRFFKTITTNTVLCTCNFIAFRVFRLERQAELRSNVRTGRDDRRAQPVAPET